MYIYLDKEKAKMGLSLVIGVFNTKQDNFDGVIFEGDNLPHYITYDEETDSIREATKEEKYQRGQYKLNGNEYYKNGVIKTYPDTPKNLINPQFDTDKELWAESATLEEQEESLRNRIISRTDELIKIQLAGFNNFELQKEIDTLRNSHLEITHQIAINSNL